MSCPMTDLSMVEPGLHLCNRMPTEEELAEMAKQEQIRQVTAQINDLKVQIAASDYK